jgi:hypothetical protein
MVRPAKIPPLRPARKSGASVGMTPIVACAGNFGLGYQYLLTIFLSLTEKLAFFPI